MLRKIADPAFAASITNNQTYELVKRFRQQFATDGSAISVLERVSLMTPENIHLNSFMYEPLIDMSDEHLSRLCQDVVNLNIRP